MAEQTSRRPSRLRALPGGREDREPEPLWREVLGRRLRALRLNQRETLAETAARAGVSPQYLSEVERGRKEPSSEMIAALAGALGTDLFGLTEQVIDELRSHRLPLRGTSNISLPAHRASNIGRPVHGTSNVVLRAA
ncbi:XRE family transcriptional regulator [Nocardia panacis]|uniref:XRE family transcriptional regulator n=1 Tax=Nocardia panacis TaxID=2340916 RepID=A0A3A4KSI2_9NOCA|nr:helix-turn-helix transcriptional regulator [Nocardia panacis]RJO79246.1 XRE family transcriptional regulator [Nocardia panacis]